MREVPLTGASDAHSPIGPLASWRGAHSFDCADAPAPAPFVRPGHVRRAPGASLPVQGVISPTVPAGTAATCVDAASGTRSRVDRGRSVVCGLSRSGILGEKVLLHPRQPQVYGPSTGRFSGLAHRVQKASKARWDITSGEVADPRDFVACQLRAAEQRARMPGRARFTAHRPTGGQLEEAHYIDNNTHAAARPRPRGSRRDGRRQASPDGPVGIEGSEVFSAK